MALRVPALRSPSFCAATGFVSSAHGTRIPVSNMATLKDLRNRLNSVKAIRKITSSMKMVAASKLRVAQTFLEKTVRPFAATYKTVDGLYEDVPTDKKHLILLVTSDRGLCGSVNSSIVKEAKKIARSSPVRDNVEFAVVGDKGRVGLSREWGAAFTATAKDMVKRPPPHFLDASLFVDQVLHSNYDAITMLYNKFVNIVTCRLTAQKFGTKEWLNNKIDSAKYEMDGMQEETLTNLYEYHLAASLYVALNEQSCSELGARTTAMDGATKNAGEMIAKLTLNYNRRRQAGITTELCEIIGGAEAIKAAD